MPRVQPRREPGGISRVFPRAGPPAGQGGAPPLAVLTNISLTVRTSEFVSIVGASGCGKTTFLRILDGLIEPSAGEVLIDGGAVTAPGRDRGFGFQKDSLWPWRRARGHGLCGLAS